MRVLLTGAAGFVGGAILQALQQAGHDVVAVDLLVPQAHGHEPLAPTGVHRLDVRAAGDGAAWSRLLDGVDAVCHQAAIVGVESSAADLPAYASHNDLGAAALLAAMGRHRIGRLVLASSMVVYGEGRYACPEHGPRQPSWRTEDDLRTGRFDHPCPQCLRPLAWLPVDEDTPLRPRSGYAASKAAQEQYAEAWARLTGGRVAALRYHNVYGPGMPRDTSYCGVAAMFRSSLERGERPRVFEDGRQTRDFVHVSDVAAANVLALESLADHVDGEATAYNIASGHPVTIAEVAAAVTGGSELEPEVTGGFRAGDVRHVVASPERARSRLGFRALVHPAVGLRELASAPLRPAGVHS